MIIALVIGLIAVMIRVWSTGTLLYESPDTRAYVAMAKGERLCDPYRLRWLLPMILPPGGRVWWIVSASAFVLSCPLIALFAEAHGVSGLWAVLLWVALPMWDINLKLCMLVDPVAWLFALISAVLIIQGDTIGAVIAVMIAGMVAPKAPVFAALWTLNPWLLLGMVPVVVAHLVIPKREAPKNIIELSQPWLTGIRTHGIHLHDAKELLLPWGGCMAAVLCGDWRILPAVIVAYAQLLRSTDSARLYMWAAPVVIIGALKVIPEAALMVALLYTWFNPVRPDS